MHNIDFSKTCVIDNDVEKLQSSLHNSILLDDYSAEDILGLPKTGTSQVKDEAWQQEHMERLGDIIIDMLDNAEDIPDYIANSGRVPEDQRP